MTGVLEISGSFVCVLFFKISLGGFPETFAWRSFRSAPGFLPHLDSGAGPAKGLQLARPELRGESRLRVHGEKRARPAREVHVPFSVPVASSGSGLGADGHAGASADSGTAGEVGLGGRRGGSLRCTEAPPPAPATPTPPRAPRTGAQESSGSLKHRFPQASPPNRLSPQTRMGPGNMHFYPALQGILIWICQPYGQAHRLTEG